jgi:prevent-host-death family protein
MAAAKTLSSESEVTVSDLREDLPNLLARVALLGESFRIMKHGKPYAVLTPIPDTGAKAKGGSKNSSEGKAHQRSS